MENIDLKTFINKLPIFLQDKAGTYISIVDHNNVLAGENYIDVASCPLPIYKSHFFGGTIVNFKNDICIANFDNNFNSFGDDVLLKVIKYLNAKGLNATKDGNDVLLDGRYKVCSYMSCNMSGCIYTAVHVSIGMDMDLINKICTKPMNKIPKGLSEVGIEMTDILRYLKGGIA